MKLIKIVALFVFALLTLGSGACTLAFLPSLGEAYVGWLPLIIGLPIALTCGGISYLLWRNLQRTKSAANPRDTM